MLPLIQAFRHRTRATSHPSYVIRRKIGIMADQSQRFYEDEEAEEILRVASALSSGEAKMSYDRLIETAAELGISPEAVAMAEEKVTADRRERALQRQFRAVQRQGYFSHLTTFICVQLFLFVINAITSPHELWFIWPLLSWGLGLAGHTLAYFFASPDSRLREYNRWKATRGHMNDEDSLRIMEATDRPSVVVGLHISGHRDERMRQKLDRAQAKLDRIESRINRL